MGKSDPPETVFGVVTAKKQFPGPELFHHNQTFMLDTFSCIPFINFTILFSFKF
jgi:hypothetical protein